MREVVSNCRDWELVQALHVFMCNQFYPVYHERHAKPKQEECLMHSTHSKLYNRCDMMNWDFFWLFKKHNFYDFLANIQSRITRGKLHKMNQEYNCIEKRRLSQLYISSAYILFKIQ